MLCVPVHATPGLHSISGRGDTATFPMERKDEFLFYLMLFYYRLFLGFSIYSALKEICLAHTVKPANNGSSALVWLICYLMVQDPYETVLLTQI